MLRSTPLPLLTSLLLLFISVLDTRAQGVRITYQGHLIQDGSPVNGTMDLTFALFATDVGATQVGTTVTNLAVTVENGLFTTPLDLIVFDVADAQWLEIGVRPNGETGAFETLTPRQELTATSSAVTSAFALSAENLISDNDFDVRAYASNKKLMELRSFNDVDAGSLPVGSGGESNVVNVVFGSPENEVTGGAVGATIGGGGSDYYYNDIEFGLQLSDRANRVSENFGTVSGGYGNKVDAYGGTISGGSGNWIRTDSVYSTIAGGRNGYVDTASQYSTISGGSNNRIGPNAPYSTIGGGRDVRVNAGSAFAAGTRARAQHEGAFVWADSEFNFFDSVREDEFAVRADNGVRIQADAGKNALEIESGGIKVTGAGVGTGTPAFIHKATVGNTSGHVTTINNVHCNNQPNAILLVTHNWHKDTASSPYSTAPFGVYYSSGTWRIFYEDISAMPEGRAFNVLVIKP